MSAGEFKKGETHALLPRLIERVRLRNRSLTLVHQGTSLAGSRCDHRAPVPPSSHHSQAIALVLLADFLPGIVLAAPFGALADRMSRRRLAVGTSFAPARSSRWPCSRRSRPRWDSRCWPGSAARCSGRRSTRRCRDWSPTSSARRRWRSSVRASASVSPWARRLRRWSSCSAPRLLCSRRTGLRSCWSPSTAWRCSWARWR